jgi:hypothetical protein
MTDEKPHLHVAFVRQCLSGDPRRYVEVTVISSDGFFTVSEFSTELWEQHRDEAEGFARRDHALARRERTITKEAP